MTTDPTNTPAAQVPTREEVARALFSTCFEPSERGTVDVEYWEKGYWPDDRNRSLGMATAIIALYAPALAKLERERDEARWEASAKGRRARIAEAALATAEAEGMRKAAGIARNVSMVFGKTEMRDVFGQRIKAQILKPGTAFDAADAILAAIPKLSGN